MKKRLLLILGGIILFSFIFVASVMWFKLFYNNGDIVQTNTSANLSIQQDENIPLNESNLIPLSSDAALNLKAYNFKVENKNTKDVLYSVLIEDSVISDDENYSSKSLLHRSQLEYQLNLNGKLIKHGMLSDIKNNILDMRNISASKINNYELRVYVSEKAQDTAWQNKYYHFEVEIKPEEE